MSSLKGSSPTNSRFVLKMGSVIVALLTAVGLLFAGVELSGEYRLRSPGAVVGKKNDQGSLRKLQIVTSGSLDGSDISEDVRAKQERRDPLPEIQRTALPRAPHHDQQYCTDTDVERRPGKIVLTTTNIAFIELTDNWLESVQRTRACPNITVVTDDDTAMAHYSNKSLRYPGLHVRKINPRKISRSNPEWASKSQFMDNRQRVALPLIQNGYEVLCTDADMFWLRDPYPYFQDDFDVAVQRELPNLYDAGFVYFKPTRNAIAFLIQWMDAVRTGDESLKPSQAMNELLKSKTIPELQVKVLHSDNFPNGKLFFNETWRAKKGEIIVVHNNLDTKLDVKVKRLKEYARDQLRST
ncbi:UDP-D-xylose:L-fucose alpha-1,3-D-xylosyltransferase 1-like isoform X2 [Acanthaster planci]|uniref:UDP-D-xylose:L-fucose alpha-1,3-D-xylosyltransferase 1-like isoform X2 n=1 Tax=Acanthaster planci TaxID=133434 RepID=A0A8B7Y7C1_ACAPL|nr:UDP-D-xylose:L-fucose alpha-1,3-D-xylosyltransferase 1-like isoform X2 [Acanthaster planci]